MAKFSILRDEEEDEADEEFCIRSPKRRRTSHSQPLPTASAPPNYEHHQQHQQQHQQRSGEGDDDNDTRFFEGPTNSGSMSVILSDPDVLDCSICFDPLTSPVFQCDNGHIACSSCCTKLGNKCPSCCGKIGYNRCRAIEKVIESVRVPCCYLRYGCRETVSYCKKDEHEEICIYAPCSCPFPDCIFRGSSRNLSQHVRIEHADFVIRFCYDSIFPVSVRMDEKFIVLQEERDGTLFILSHGNTVTVRCIDPSLSKGRFAYDIVLSKGGSSLKFRSSTHCTTVQDLEKYASSNAVQEWKRLLDAILPLSAAAMALPPLSIRGDLGVFSTAAARYGPSLLKSFAQMGPQGALGATKLLRPFSDVVDSLGLKDPFVRNWIDLLAFLLAGVKSNGILSAEMIYMFAEWYKPGCVLEYPLHGSGEIVSALVRGIQKYGGRLSLRSHVEKIVIENGRAVGVRLRSGQFVRANKAVVSNASMWDTLDLLPNEAVPNPYQDRIRSTQQCESFMHLHLGFDAEESREDLGIHHIVVNDWTRGVDADQNVVLISVPSALSPNLAPPGKHILHAYTPGTEPFGLWEGLDRRSDEYKRLKAERAEVLWRAVERALGPKFDREKCEVNLVGTPLTHQRFLRRNRGTYGPAIQAGKDTFPGHPTPIPQLYCCGDSTFPGIGVPAVAASGAIVANSLVSVSQHSQLLDAVGI